MSNKYYCECGTSCWIDRCQDKIPCAVNCGRMMTKCKDETIKLFDKNAVKPEHMQRGEKQG